MADKVLVTGASGFIAQHVILQLLERGYDVRGTLRSLRRADEVRAILAQNSPRGGSIELVEANLEADAGWTEAVAGCAYVQHVASPIPATMPRDENELIRPARDGALRVLKASKAAGVRRVVMTSSMAAIAYGHGANRAPVSDETMWSDPKGADNTAYTRSKTIAERAAWDYVNGEGKGLELATINPSAVLGPALSKDASPSLEIVLQLLGGKLPGMPRLGFSVVDVRDVAACHVAAMTNPAAAGERFIASDRFVWMKDCAAMLREAFPQKAKAIPTGGVPDWVIHLMAVIRPIYKQTLTELGRTRNVSNAKAQRVLGVTFRSAEEAVNAAGRSALDLGMV
jgi:dihydroflavonol-4-reductase